MSNAVIADVLRRYAAVLSLEGANRFRIKAYQRAAESIEGLHENVEAMIAQGQDLTTLHGVGTALATTIREIVRTGTLHRLEEKVSQLPPEVAELSGRPALDPKKVARVYKKLGIKSLAELKQSLESGRIAQNLGSGMAFHVRQGLDDRPRRLLYDVEDLAGTIEKRLTNMPGVARASRVGSLRRKQDTIGDLNFLVAGSTAAEIFGRVDNAFPVLAAESRSHSEKVSKLSSGLLLSLKWTPIDEWGLALIVTTGSHSHLESLKQRAKEMQLQFTGKGLAGAGIDPGDERAIYEALGLAYVEPELRDGRGEVTSATDRNLPALITVTDIRGDLHMHTLASDGVNTIAEMAAAAQERGYEYIAITDHSQSLKITNGLSEKRLRQHMHDIDKVNRHLKGFRILKSAEVDILEDGKLDYPDALLNDLDLTICSIHSRFRLNRDQQTTRILRAMDNRYFNILGHATGRLLLRRPGYDVDIERIIKHAKAVGCFFEINSSPDRLDLSDENAFLAKKAGVKIAVNTDAHSIKELAFMSAGINQARRGWLEADDVLNTYPLKTLLTFLRR